MESRTTARFKGVGSMQKLIRAGLTCLMFALPATGSAASFDEQRKAIASAIETQPEKAILDLLKAGIAEGKPTQAIAETRRWLRQNVVSDPLLQYHAGRAAELSGDARGAAALYQQFLQKSDSKSEETGKAILATHSLLRDRLNDSSAAYSFNRSTVSLHCSNPMARQWDGWYLGEAMRRKDATAVAERLTALRKAGVKGDHWEVYYHNSLRWLVDSAKGYIDRGGNLNLTDEMLAAYRALSKELVQSDKEMGLLLPWLLSVRSYNLAMIAGEDAKPPLEEATALLKEFPRYALLVQHGWAGGGNGQHYRGDPAKYWPHRVDEKMKPVVEAAGRLGDLDLADLLASWRDGYYADRTVRPAQLEVVQGFLASDPGLMNSRLGVFAAPKSPEKMTPEEAMAFAPKVSANPSPEVSFLEAVAAGGADKDFDRMIDSLIGEGAWRVTDKGWFRHYADRLWHYAGRPGGNTKRDQGINKAKQVADAKSAKPVTPQMSAAERLKVFEALWKDFRSDRPKTPGVMLQVQNALKATPEAVAWLLKEGSTEAQFFVRRAIAEGIEGPEPVWKQLESAIRVNTGSYSPGILYLAGRHGGGRMDELKKRRPEMARSHPLEATFREFLKSGAAKNSIAPWQVIAWINMQYLRDDEGARELISAIMKSAAWKKMPFEVQFAAREWFGTFVMSEGQKALKNASDPMLVVSEMLAFSDGSPEKKLKKKKLKKKNKQGEPEDTEDPGEEIELLATALEATLAKLKAAPIRVEVPDSAFEAIRGFPVPVFENEKVIGALLTMVDDYKVKGTSEGFGFHFLTAVSKDADPVTIHRVAPYLWTLIGRHHRLYGSLKDLVSSQLEPSPSAASTLASAGLDAFARHRGHTYFNRELDIPLFKSIRGKAAMKMGLVEIPVPRDSPAYPVYESQGDWITGNDARAWELVDANWEAFMPVHRELSMGYLKWVLERIIYGRDEVRQEELIKALMAWASEDGSPLSPSEKIEIEIFYGDIAMQRGQLRQAHEIYSRTATKEEYRDYDQRHQATLRRAKAERIAKNFDGALQTLNQLELERVPGLGSEIRYARALVYFDMEEFDDAGDEIDKILTSEPNHPDAKILLGKVQLKRQKLMEATEVELGSTSQQKTIVPGEKLKVTLNDPTLAVSGAGTEIEVVVWASSGDKETFYLRQFGDQKTKFRGEIETALGEPAEGDRTLQVIGDDEIFYAYSERFRKRMNDIPEKKGGPITVASDAVLMASARKLLTASEQRLIDMEELMKDLERRGAKNAEQVAKSRLAAESMSIEARAGDDPAEFQSRIATIVKPGNPINVRVIDPDRSRTDQVDEIMVSVASSSGDSISRFVLKETGTHSGWFEGRIPTTGAQAMAFASKSEPGRNPNMLISPKTDYPAWRPVIEKDKVPELTIDLNDNLPIGKMTVKASEEGAKLKNFIVQTAMNPGSWTTVACYPEFPVAIPDPWKPSVVVMNDTDRQHDRNDRSVFEFDEIKAHVASGWTTQKNQQGVARNLSGPSEAFLKAIPSSVKWRRHNRHDVSHVIYRFRAYFHEPKDVTRTFKVDLGKYEIPPKTHPSINHPPEFLIAVDGRPISKEGGPLEGSVNLREGVHSFEIWATGWVNNLGFGRSCRVMANLEQPAQMVNCPDRFFDPSAFPPGVLDHRNSPGEIVASANGESFEVNFAEGSRTRLLRLIFLGQEGPVPAVNRVTLTGPDGAKILPVPEDFASLGKNDTLEILTGDRIFVRYVDDRYVTKSRERLERSLDVSFTDAKVEFADMEPRFDGRKGKVMPFYEKLLRFSYDKSLALAVHDADMDATVEPDTVMVMVESPSGGKRELMATETGPSTGVFKATIIPVAGPASDESQISVKEGEYLVASYIDAENRRPGVSTTREGRVLPAGFSKPSLSIAHATAEFKKAVTEDGKERSHWWVERVLTKPEKAPEGGIALLHGQLAHLELDASQLALRPSSIATIYAQTESGRKAAGKADVDEFDVSVPGTIALEGELSSRLRVNDWRMLRDWKSENYRGGGFDWGLSDPSVDHLFRFSVPLVAGVLPLRGVLSEEEKDELRGQLKTSRSAARILEEAGGGLVVKTGEKVYFGLSYKDADGKDQWLTATAKVAAHPVFGIMDEEYREKISTAYAGETLNLRVSDFGADTTDAIDEVSVLIQSKSGSKGRITLRETDPHSGVFTGGALLSYAKKEGALPEGYSIARDGLPVVYGDTVAARYTDANGIKTPISMVTISKGADGTIQPFSKQYEDSQVAMRTQFSLAEAYLEIAKRHRRLGETELAAREYEQAKQLLANAMEDFRDPDTRAHAEYLLGNLTLEEADATLDGELKEDRYRAALSRFMTVTGSYPETLHASKAQFRIATIYEKLKEPEIAAQEYVKLAYKYPESEHLATSMVRLGSHFLKKAAKYETESKALLEKEDDKDALFKGEALGKMAAKEYLKTAQIFSRMQERFPNHDMAGPAGLRAGQAYMRAGELSEAIAAFARVISEKSYDGKEIRSQAMYWTGKCYQDKRELMAAYSMYKRLTYDFPESEWAAYARGQLSEGALLNLEYELEMKRLEEDE